MVRSEGGVVEQSSAFRTIYDDPATHISSALKSGHASGKYSLFAKVLYTVDYARKPKFTETPLDHLHSE